MCGIDEEMSLMAFTVGGKWRGWYQERKKNSMAVEVGLSTEMRKNKIQPAGSRFLLFGVLGCHYCYFFLYTFWKIILSIILYRMSLLLESKELKSNSASYWWNLSVKKLSVASWIMLWNQTRCTKITPH